MNGMLDYKSCSIKFGRFQETAVTHDERFRSRMLCTAESLVIKSDFLEKKRSP